MPDDLRPELTDAIFAAVRGYRWKGRFGFKQDWDKVADAVVDAVESVVQPRLDAKDVEIDDALERAEQAEIDYATLRTKVVEARDALINHRTPSAGGRIAAASAVLEDLTPPNG